MKHYGDITKLSGYDLPVVDCITGGSPCQDLSVAGKRAGLDGERSVLFMEQIRIIKEMRDNDRRNGRTDEFIRPRFMVWENVPGAFSSNKGEDFRIVLEKTARIADETSVIPRPPKDKWTNAGAIMGDGWSIAWRVHDAQFWGVPQRRKRIALVADFGGQSAPEILFERKGLSRDSKQGREERERAAESAERCADDTVKCYGISPYDSNAMKSKNPHSGVYEAETSRTLGLNGGSPACNQGGMAVVDYAAAFKFGNSSKARSIGYQEDCSPTLSGADGGNGKPCVVCLEGNGSRESHRGDGYKESETMYTLNTIEQHAVCIGNGQVNQLSKSPVARALNCMHDQQAVFVKTTKPHSVDEAPTIEQKDVSPTLNNFDVGDARTNVYVVSNKDQQAVAFDRAAYNQGKNAQYNFSIENDIAQTAVAKDPGGVSCNHVIRRLTPLECERLQGFPDGWTDIGDWTDSKGKKHKGDADSPRYKALGNSIATPFWFWLLRRISAQYERPATLGSLFDGIGGFPLCWERCNGQGTALWASEIEEFPIAVTKHHFPEEEHNERT